MTLILGFALLLLLGFWLIGARNRLVRLRQAVSNAYPPLELQLRKRHALTRHLAEAARHGAAMPREALESALAAARQAAEAVEAVSPRQAWAQAPLRRLASAEEVLAASLTALMPMGEPFAQDPEAPKGPSANDPTITELQARIAQLHAPLDYARQSFNGAVQVYNAALKLFPTTLAAALFRFEPAAMLPRLSKPSA